MHWPLLFCSLSRAMSALRVVTQYNSENCLCEMLLCFISKGHHSEQSLSDKAAVQYMHSAKEQTDNVSN